MRALAIIGLFIAALLILGACAYGVWRGVTQPYPDPETSICIKRIDTLDINFYIYNELVVDSADTVVIDTVFGQQAITYWEMGTRKYDKLTHYQWGGRYLSDTILVVAKYRKFWGTRADTSFSSWTLKTDTIWSPCYEVVEKLRVR